MFYKNEKLAVFIDGSNLFATSKALGFDIDYKKLYNWFVVRGNLMRIHYYTALVESDDNNYNVVKPLVDWLSYNGFDVVSKTVKEYVDSNGRRKAKGNMDVELTIDAMRCAKNVEHIVIFSGDGDFKPLVDALKQEGVRVTVISTLNSPSAMIADSLRRSADKYIDLSDIQKDIERETRQYEDNE